jgi:hypothetical protein
VHIGHTGGIAEVEYLLGAIDIGSPRFLTGGTVKGQTGGTMDDGLATTMNFVKSIGGQKITGKNFGHRHHFSVLFFPVSENLGNSMFGGLFPTRSDKNGNVLPPAE